MFGSMDDYLISRCEKISHWFQIWFGITNFILSRVFVVLGIAAGIVYSSSRLANQTSKFGVTLTWAVMILFVVYIEMTVREYYLHANFRNRQEFQSRSLRIVFVFGATFLLIFLWLGYPFWLLTIRNVCLVFASYFVACTPLPPGQSKVKSWINRWSAKTAKVNRPVATLS